MGKFKKLIAKRIYLSFRKHIKFTWFESPVDMSFRVRIDIFGYEVAVIRWSQREIVEKIL